jgi:hypothetical protein
LGEGKNKCYPSSMHISSCAYCALTSNLIRSMIFIFA